MEQVHRLHLLGAAIAQSTIAPDMQGRVFNLMGSLLSLTSPLGLALAGPISDLVGLQVWYLAAAALSGAMGIAGFFIPVLANVEENPSGATQVEAVPTA